MPQNPRHDTPTPSTDNRDPELHLSQIPGEERIISDAMQDEVEAEIDLADDRRVIKAEAQGGQGPKTRSRNKQIVSGKPYD